MPTSARTSSNGNRTINGHNEGSIWWREDRKRWVAEVTLPDGRRRTAQAKTKLGAKQGLERLTHTRKASAGLHPHMLLGRYLEWWVDDVKKRVGRKTHDGYAGIVENHLIKGLGHLRLDQLSVRIVEDFLLDPERGVDNQTIRNHRAALRKALNDAAHEEVVPLGWNPAAKARPPRIDNLPKVILSVEQVVRIIDDPEPDRLHALWVLNSCSGMREAEELGLTYDDIEASTVRLRYQLVREDGEWVRRELKTKRIRDIELPLDAVEALRRHRIRQAEERLAAGHGGEYHGLIFTTTTGAPLYAWQVLRDWYRLLERLDLPRLTFHAGGRHTYSSAAMEAGTDWRVAADQTGQSTAAMVGHYSHVSPTLRRAAANDYQTVLEAARSRGAHGS